MREHWESGRKDLPPLQWIKVEKRTITYGEWEDVSETQMMPQAEARKYVDAHPEKYPAEVALAAR